jgi:hypothetical protein
VHSVLKDFYHVNENWLAKLLERGQKERDTPYPVPPAMLAQVIYRALQSGLIAARLFGTRTVWNRRPKRCLARCAASAPRRCSKRTPESRTELSAGHHPPEASAVRRYFVLLQAATVSHSHRGSSCGGSCPAHG